MDGRDPLRRGGARLSDLHDADLEEVFRTEAEAILADLEGNLLRLEEEGAGGEAQEEAYRHFHTLKGMARMAGREEVATICHAAETALRPGELPRVNALLEARDEAARLLREAETLEDAAPEPETPEARTVPVDLRRLDNLLNLVGELVVAENRVQYERKHHGGAITEASVESLGHVVRALRDEVVRARLIPARTLFSRLPRLARDAAHDTGKDVIVDVAPGDVELDRAIVDRLTGALAHLVQNAVVHGIEAPDAREAAGKPREGRIRLDARREHEMVIVEVSDDGRGIDVEAVRARAVEKGLLEPDAGPLTPEAAVDLLLAAGFTTREEAGTRAGRGVGLTAAREIARGLGGELDVRARPGEGLRVTFRLPPSIAVLETLVARADRTTIALPLRNVRRIAHASAAQRFGNALSLLHEGAPVPVRTVTGDPARSANGGFVILADGAAGPFGLRVEEIVGTHASVLKPIPASESDGDYLLGATVLGSGELAVILNPDAYAGGNDA